MWGAGFQFYGFSALLKPIASDLGLSRAATSVAASISRLEGGFQAPLAGWLTDRFGPRWIAFCGVFLFGIGLVLMYFISSLWTLYVVWGVILGTGLNALMLPLDKSIANWFVKKRGLVLSIRWIFTGLSAVVLLPVLTWLINTQGWRTACAVGGLVMALVGLPLTWFGIKKHRPEYYGLLPDGAEIRTTSKEDADKTIERGIKYATEVEEVEFTLRQAMRTPTYWLLIVVEAGRSLGTHSVLMHIIPFLTDIGMDSARAAATVSIAAALSLISRFAVGFLADHVKKDALRLLYGGALLLEALGITIFMLNQTIAMVYPFLIIWNIGLGGGLVLMSIIGGRYFGRKAFASIRGSIAMFTMPIGILGPIYAGWIYDTTGNYVTALTIFSVVLAFVAALISFTRPPRPPAEVTDIRKFI